MASTLRSFENGLVYIAERMEFGHINAALVIEQGQMDPIFLALGNTPVEFLNASKNVDNSKRDPVLQKMKKLSVPFIYDQATYVDSGAGDLWEEQAAHGFRTGVSVALHLPGEKHFLLGVDRAQSLPDDDVELTRMMAQLQLLAVHAQDAALRLMTKGTLDAEIRLTQRETEALKLTMDGFTAAAIADRLNVSESTVQFHLTNVRKKFGASSKHQAVLRAIQLGLI